MRRLAYAIFWGLATATVAAGPAAAAWESGGVFVQVQGEKGRPGQGPERFERGRDARQERRDDRGRDRMSEDDRRSLHRDLDKANRELYGRRPQR
jgi:hypothetical protein